MGFIYDKTTFDGYQAKKRDFGFFGFSTNQNREFQKIRKMTVEEPKPLPRAYKALQLDEAFVRLDTPVRELRDLPERIIQVKEVRNRYK